MVRVPAHPDAVRALSTYELPDSTVLADLGALRVLCDLDISRVTDVIERDTHRTQRLAARIVLDSTGDGISWWSSHHPTITLIATWRAGDIRCLDTQPVTITDAAVHTAADLIVRTIRSAEAPMTIPAQSRSTPARCFSRSSCSR